MKKIDLLIGVLLGFGTAFLGVFIFLECFTDYCFSIGIQEMRSRGYLGKVITLGAILNILVVFVLFRKDKELMARGVILSVFLLTILTLVI